MVSNGYTSKTINHPVFTERKALIRCKRHRYKCRICGRTLSDPDPFAFDNFRSSFLLLRSCLEKLSNLQFTVKMISDELGISSTQIATYIDSYITVPKRQLPESIGIDEIHSKALSSRNAAYICVLVDNDRRCLYDVLPSRSKSFLSSFFFNIPKEERLHVKYITIDMYQNYKDIALTYFPNADIAVDPFHVVKHLSDDFEKLRIKLMNNCERYSTSYYLLKKFNFLLRKDSVNLDNDPVYNRVLGRKLNYRDIFNMIMDTFPKLHVAYYLKEEYRRFNKTASYEVAFEVYDDMIAAFRNADIKEYDEFINILITWKTEILNSFKRDNSYHRLSNAFTENINGKIKILLTNSKGIKNFDRFRNRVLLALNPDVSYALSANLKHLNHEGKSKGSYNKNR